MKYYLTPTKKTLTLKLTNPNPNSKDSLQAYHQLLHRTSERRKRRIYQNSKHNMIREHYKKIS